LVSSEFKDLIARIFVPQPPDRIGLEEIFAHPWFAKDLPAGIRERTDNSPKSTQKQTVLLELLKMGPGGERGESGSGLSIVPKATAPPSADSEGLAVPPGSLNGEICMFVPQSGKYQQDLLV
jgi:hypothetical protein